MVEQNAARRGHVPPGPGRREAPGCGECGGRARPCYRRLRLDQKSFHASCTSSGRPPLGSIPPALRTPWLPGQPIRTTPGRSAVEAHRRRAAGNGSSPVCEEANLGSQSLASYQPFCGAPFRSIPDEHERGRNLRLYVIEYFHGIQHALDRTEIRQVHKNLVVLRRQVPALLEVAVGLEQVAVDEVGNHLDGATDVELLEGNLPQILRDSRDTIALLDGKAVMGR